MNTLDLKAIRDLRELRSQVLTISLVVAAGVGVLIASLTAYASMSAAQENFYGVYRFADVFGDLKRAPIDLVADIARIPGVQTVESRLVHDAILNIISDSPAETGANGDPSVGRFVSLPDEGPQLLNRVHLRRGRLPEPYHSGEVLVSEGFAVANGLEPGRSVAAILNGRYRRFLIVGTALSPEYVYAFRGANPMPDDKHFGVFWISRRALAGALDQRGAFNSVCLDLSTAAHVETVIHEVDELLRPYGGLGSYGRKDQGSHTFLSDEIEQLEVQAYFIPGIFLGVAAFLLNVVIGRLVNKQREQVATLKALGFDNLTIAIHYFKIVGIIVTIGTLAGFALGVWMGREMTEMYRDFYRFPSLAIRFHPIQFVVGAFVSYGAAAGGVLNTLWATMRLPPAEAMRPPAPPVYRASIGERLHLTRLFGTVGRMIIRNITLKPVGTGLAIVGLAFAVVILVLGFFFSDMFAQMLYVQYTHIQREDAQVAFNYPVSERAIRELQNQPGVMYAEGYRVLPVRIHGEHRNRETGLLGLPRDARLRQLLDRDFRRLNLPPDGILMNRKLAERIGVRPGEMIRMEVLEGRRPEFQILLSATVEEYIGGGAYIERDYLNRLLKEQGTVNQAALRVDEMAADALYSRLKRFPGIAAVNTRRAAMQIFQETMTKMVLAFAFILTLFACVIAFGVVYNMAMVSLSERNRDIATMRVLGFTRREVFEILAGELLFQMALAIPLGCLLGVWFAHLTIASINTEGLNLPVTINLGTFLMSGGIVFGAGLLSIATLRHRIQTLDLVAVLKMRE